MINALEAFQLLGRCCFAINVSEGHGVIFLVMELVGDMLFEVDLVASGVNLSPTMKRRSCGAIVPFWAVLHRLRAARQFHTNHELGGTMNYAKRTAALLLITALSACQTMTGLTTPEAVMMQKVTATHCVVQYDNSAQNTKNIRYDSVFVHSLQDRDDGWKAADISSSDGRGGVIRDNIYYNLKTGQYACGAGVWNLVNSSPTTKTFAVSPIILNSRIHIKNANDTENMVMRECVKSNGVVYPNKMTRIMCNYLGGNLK